MLAPGETYPQQFALGVLQLYSAIKQKRTEIDEMRRARGEQWLLAQQQMEAEGKENEARRQLQSELAKMQNATAQAAYDAKLKFDYEVLRDQRKASAQRAVQDFAEGKATFFPLGVAVPKAPTIKDAEGVEKPTFDVYTQDIPSLGTFVVPYNRLTDTYGLRKLDLELQHTKMQSIKEGAEIEATKQHSALWAAQIEKAQREVIDPALLGKLVDWSGDMRKRFTETLKEIQLLGTPEERKDVQAALVKRLGAGDAQKGRQILSQLDQVEAMIASAALKGLVPGAVLDPSDKAPPPGHGAAPIGTILGPHGALGPTARASEVRAAQTVAGALDASETAQDALAADRLRTLSGLRNQITTSVYVTSDQEGNLIEAVGAYGTRGLRTKVPAGAIPAMKTTYYDREGNETSAEYRLPDGRTVPAGAGPRAAAPAATSTSAAAVAPAARAFAPSPGQQFKQLTASENARLNELARKALDPSASFTPDELRELKRFRAAIQKAP